MGKVLRLLLGATAMVLVAVMPAAAAPAPVSITLASVNGSTAHGTAALAFTGPSTLRVVVQMSALAPNSVHPEHIHAGSCAAGGGIKYPLADLHANAAGAATATTVIANVSQIPASGWFVNVHTGPTLLGAGANPIACGDIALSAPVSAAQLPKTGSDPVTLTLAVAAILAGSVIVVAELRRRRA